MKHAYTKTLVTNIAHESTLQYTCAVHVSRVHVVTHIPILRNDIPFTALVVGV